MFELTYPTGELIFETTQVAMVCKDCEKAGKREQCTHMNKELPPWLSEDNVEMIKILLQDDPELLLRETMGVNAESTTRAFREQDVEMFVSRALVPPERIMHIFTAVDPAGGGASAFAICSIALTSSGQVMIIGAEALNTREAHVQHNLLLDHINSLREIDQFRRSTVVLGVESNLGFEAQHTIHAMKRLGLRNCCPLHEGVDGTLGMLTTHKSKEVMCAALQELLSMNRLHTCDKFVSKSMSPRAMLSRLLDEMRAFMIYVDSPKTLFAQARRTYTGKLGGHQDDVIIALQMAILAMQCFMKHDRYTQFR